MSTIKPILIGIIIGILLFILVVVGIGLNLKSKVVTDYGDEVQGIVSTLETSKEPVLQLDYLIAGLLLSPEFQNYLDEGVQKGWWNEEYLSQVLLDDLLPIYAKQYGSTFKAIKSQITKTDFWQKIQKLIPKIKEIVSKLDPGQIKEIIYKIRNKIMSLDLSKLALAINRIKDLISNLNFEQLQIIINKVKNFINDLDLGALKDKLDDIKYKIKDVIDQIQDLVDSINKDKIQDAIDKIKDAINKIKDIINDLDVDKIQDLIDKIKDIINDLDPDQIQDIKDKIEDLIDKIKDIISKIDIEDIKDKIEDIKDKISDIVGDVSDLIDTIKELIDDLITYLKNLLDNIYNWIIADIDGDFDFNSIYGRDGAVDGNITIDGKDIPITVLNGIDVYINYSVDDQGTTGVGNKGDDEITIYSITFTFERFMSGESGGLRYVYPLNGESGITLTNHLSSGLAINRVIDIVNSKI